ncbi:MAG TPA: haloacid dehalogenase-like hydrolase [Terriglobales bacterium]|nr:haloacid dehalogenase-like hydrolase [Terriglobales bacterium]
MPERAAGFLASVLRLAPKVAVFDCDGTLWSPDAGEGFLRWELERGLIAPDVASWVRARYDEYKAGQVAEEVMCGEMVTIHAGLRDEVLERAAEEYFAPRIDPWIFPEMRALVGRLQQQGSQVWAVSSSNQWIIRVAMRRFGIPRERILAAEVAVENGVITDRLIRVPSGPGKAVAIRDKIGGSVDAAFGNTRWDAEMLQMARHPFAINPTADFEQFARQNKWTVYFPDSLRSS